MKKISSLLLFLLLLCTFSIDSHAAVKIKAKVTGCTTVREIGSDVYKNSKPIRACSAITCPIVRFDQSPSLLINTKGTPQVASASLLDANGGYLTSCGIKDCRDCKQGFRYVCLSGTTSSIAKKAKANANSYTVYYKAGTQCVQIKDIGKCVGSVKGLCNKTIR